MTCVLVVDDDPRLSQLISLTLREGGLEVVSTQDGSEALSVVDEDEPSLIILDLMMPKMDGPTFLRQARSHGYGGPIVVLSASQSGSIVSRRIGANAFLAKPFDPDRLLECVERLLEHDSCEFEAC